MSSSMSVVEEDLHLLSLGPDILLIIFSHLENVEDALKFRSCCTELLDTVPQRMFLLLSCKPLLLDWMIETLRYQTQTSSCQNCIETVWQWAKRWYSVWKKTRLSLSVACRENYKESKVVCPALEHNISNSTFISHIPDYQSQHCSLVFVIEEYAYHIQMLAGSVEPLHVFNFLHPSERNRTWDRDTFYLVRNKLCTPIHKNSGVLEAFCEMFNVQVSTSDLTFRLVFYREDDQQQQEEEYWKTNVINVNSPIDNPTSSPKDGRVAFFWPYPLTYHDFVTMLYFREIDTRQKLFKTEELKHIGILQSDDNNQTVNDRVDYTANPTLSEKPTSSAISYADIETRCVCKLLIDKI